MTNVQHHAQDDFGQYDYGYSNPVSTKTEVKTADGVVRGTYSYIDANNVVQTVHYISDALGFRVQATNLPQAPNVEQPAQPVSLAPSVYAPNYQEYVQTVETPDTYGAEPVDEAPDVSYGSVPIVQAPVSSPIITKYHAQDELGGYQFGYTDGVSNRDEIRNPNGVVQGSYTYLDDQGVPQTVAYLADHNGFQVQASNLPMDEINLPEQVQDTPEVAAAKAEHYRLVAEIKATNQALEKSLEDQHAK